MRQEGKKLIKEYKIDNYHVNALGELKLQSLLLFLQDMADVHSSLANIGVEFCKKNNIAWVLANSHLVIERMPRANETITIISWPFSIRRIGSKREYLIKCGEEVLIRASYLWICLDMIKKRPVSMLDYVTADYAHEEVVLETSFKKIARPEEMTKSMSFPVLFSDLDINNHVNNAVYPIWALDSLGADWLQSHTLKELELQYKEETLLNESITVSNFINEQEIIQVIEKENNNPSLLMASKWEKR